ncbi:hypothetical protein pdam_00006574 [Pocillopora damicornis]|uniref:D-isomer specific 2-hydroxyacid dehydrogenase NAD-binding domain-containing protein n=1 Tax=Pocillopora damicornis TaxID=46731 RepID=A0A3M6T8N2_POCDA|nr:hypothetical protein pdam_00006574 [Pocillopora damicornis]
MKSTATLINVGRGETVNHADLTVALQKGVIKAAALDVTDPPVLPRDHPLLNMSNVIITPHIAYLTTSVQQLRCSTSLDNLRAGVKGQGFGLLSATSWLTEGDLLATCSDPLPDDIPARGGADSTSVGVLFFPPHGSHHW